MDENAEDNEGDMEVGHVKYDVEQNFVGNLNHSFDDLGCLEHSVDDAIAELLVAQMGSTGRQRLREHRAGVRRIVSEMYSPALVAQMIRAGGCGIIYLGSPLTSL